MAIPARVSITTIGVRDFAMMRAFYAGLGWRNMNPDLPSFAAFDTGGAVLALFPLGLLAEDAHVAADDAPAFRGVAFAMNVERADLVDAAIEELRAKGARITKEPEDAEWGGRSAYWADPEGNLWEVAWAPGTSFDARGALVWTP
jgi:catechol 2,3-dioxygenase-like lactoylglutathione lyase family enzyme